MSKSKKEPIKIERAYSLLIRPFISEKTTKLTAEGKVVFWVAPDATKPKIKKAVESLFETKVKSVNMICQRGKRKRFRGVWGKRKDYKKAIVSLEKGESVELLTEVKS